MVQVQPFQPFHPSTRIASFFFGTQKTGSTNPQVGAGRAIQGDPEKWENPTSEETQVKQPIARSI